MSYEFILFTSWAPDKKEFLSSLEISPDGFGSQLFLDVFNAFFIESIDLVQEYRDFYSVEYPTFSEYIESTFGKVLDESEQDSTYAFLVPWLPVIISDYHEGNKLDVVLACIKQLGKDDES